MPSPTSTPLVTLESSKADQCARQGPPVLDLRGLSKSFGGKTVLHPFQLQIAPGEVHALLGQNGSGKSTLIKLLSGYHQPDPGGSGWVGGNPLTFGSPEASRRMGLRFVHQDLGLLLKSTVLDNFFFGRGFPRRLGTIQSKHAERECSRALEGVGLDVDPNDQVITLSPAQRTGLAVARAVHAGDTPAQVLILDEPTATLPAEEVTHLHRMLASAAAEGVGILYVTHFIAEVYAFAQRVSVLRDGHLVASCSVSETTQRELVHELVGGELETVHRAIARKHARRRPGSPTLSVREISGPSLQGVSFDAAAGEIVGVYGLTGSGRESLLGTIFGASPREGGEVRVKGRVLPGEGPAKSVEAGVGYLPPDRKVGGFMQLPATENVTLIDLHDFWSNGSLHSGRELLEVARWFETLQVRPLEALRAPLSSFSGGNQQKILLAKWLRMNLDVLLLDEPTQGVDVGAKAILHQQINTESDRGAVVIISSTDVEELVSLCDRVLVMQNGRVVAHLMGETVTAAAINRASHNVEAAENWTDPDDSKI